METDCFSSQAQRKGLAFSEVGGMLIEALVAIGVLAIVGLGAATQMSQMGKLAGQTYSVKNRDQIAQRIQTLAANPAALYWSAKDSANTALANCVMGTGGATACSTRTGSAATIYPLILKQPNQDVPLTGILKADNTPQTEIFYDLKSGLPCSAQAGSAQCPIGVSTYFTATCPRDGMNVVTQCRQAESIEVTYLVRYARNDTSAVNAETALRNTLAKVVVPTSSLAMYKPQQRSLAGGGDTTPLGCADGEVAVGVNGGGNILCQKIANICPPGTLTVGFDRYGRPISQLEGAQQNTGIGAFNGAAQIKCISASCGNQLMTAMMNDSPLTIGGVTTYSLAPECFGTSLTCTNEGNESNTTPPSVFFDLLSSGGANPTSTVTCNDLQSCYASDPDGQQAAPLNFTHAIRTYNGTSPTVVDAACEAWQCNLNQYMTDWDADGRCVSNPRAGGGPSPSPTPSPSPNPTPTPTPSPSPTPGGAYCPTLNPAISSVSGLGGAETGSFVASATGTVQFQVDYDAWHDDNATTYCTGGSGTIGDSGGNTIASAGFPDPGPGMPGYPQGCIDGQSVVRQTKTMTASVIAGQTYSVSIYSQGGGTGNQGFKSTVRISCP